MFYPCDLRILDNNNADSSGSRLDPVFLEFQRHIRRPVTRSLGSFHHYHRLIKEECSISIPMATITAGEFRQYAEIEEASVPASAGQCLLQPEHAEIDPSVIATGVPTSLALRLYVSHFLSAWNSRVFEFGAALFLASIFPGSLMPISIYSLVRNAGYIMFAQSVGSWIEKGNRLSVIRASIIGQRVPVAVSCALFLALLLKPAALGPEKEHGIFVVIVVLAVVEKLCSTMNMISVERDWVRVCLIHRCLGA